MISDPEIVELFATDPDNPDRFDSDGLSYAALTIRHANLLRDVHMTSRQSPIAQIAAGPGLMMEANALLNDLLEALGRAEAKIAEKSS